MKICLSLVHLITASLLLLHVASAQSEEEVAQWRGEQQVFPPSAPAGEAVRFQRLSEEEQPKDTIEQVILRRGSTRGFDKTASITLAQLSTILDHSTRGLPADFLEPPGAQLNDLYLIVHAVQGLKPGAYFFRRELNTRELLKVGSSAARPTILGLKQELPADACVDIFFLADLQTHPEGIREPRLPGRQAGGGAQSAGGCTWLRMPSAWVQPG